MCGGVVTRSSTPLNVGLDEKHKAPTDNKNCGKECPKHTSQAAVAMGFAYRRLPSLSSIRGAKKKVAGFAYRSASANALRSSFGS